MSKRRCSHLDCGKPLDLTKAPLGTIEDWVYDPRTLNAWCPEHIPKIYDTESLTTQTWGAAGYSIVGGWVDEWVWMEENSIEN